MTPVCAMFSPECHGRLEWHHAIKQQRLRRQFPHGGAREFGDPHWMPIARVGPEWGTRTIPLDDILGDSRNRIWLCSHHHELVTNGRLQCELPPSVWEFAREFGLVGMLENDLARRSAA